LPSSLRLNLALSDPLCSYFSPFQSDFSLKLRRVGNANQKGIEFYRQRQTFIGESFITTPKADGGTVKVFSLLLQGF